MKQSVIPILLITIIYHSVLGAQIMAPDDAVKISNSEYLEASAGTILWTGLDFQGLTWALRGKRFQTSAIKQF